MTMLRALASLCAAILLAACQTAGGNPTSAKAALLVAEGFTSLPTETFNRNLETDDIRTTGLYLCAKAQCGGFAMVMFGVDPEASGSQKDFDELARQPRGQGLRSANRLLRSAGMQQVRVVDFATSSLPDGARVYRIDAVGLSTRERTSIRFTGLYRVGSGRVVIAQSRLASVARRFGGADMLD